MSRGPIPFVPGASPLNCAIRRVVEVVLAEACLGVGFACEGDALFQPRVPQANHGQYEMNLHPLADVAWTVFERHCDRRLQQKNKKSGISRNPKDLKKFFFTKLKTNAMYVHVRMSARCWRSGPARLWAGDGRPLISYSSARRRISLALVAHHPVQSVGPLRQTLGAGQIQFSLAVRVADCARGGDDHSCS